VAGSESGGVSVTPEFGWPLIEPTDFVTNLPADFETFADAVDDDLKGLLGGTTGQVLTKVSNADNDYAFATISAGGMTLLSTTALTGAAVTVSGISGSFKNLQIVMRNVSHASNGGYPLIFPNGSSSISDSYQINSYNNALTINRSDAIRPTNARGTQGASSYDVVVNIYDYANTVSPKLVDFVAGYEDTGDTPDTNVVNGKARIKTNSAITSLEFNAQSSNFDAGSVLIYGVS
jgi:hypothetical protein